jgi:diacylglycerol kinase family enzyme
MIPPTPVDVAASFHIVLNVGSGSNDGAVTRNTIETILAGTNREHRVRVVERPEQLDQVARQTVDEARSCGGVVVAAGGDGTIRTVAQATLGSGCLFGVLPQGTFNYFGRTHGIPSHTADATLLLLSAHAHPVQVALVNDRVFLVNASLGLYPELLEDRETYTRKFGRSRLVALWSALATLLHEHRTLHLLIEDEGETRPMRTPTLFVGNNRLQLEQIGIAQAPDLEHGLLIALTARPVGMLARYGLMVRGALGELGTADDVISFAFRRIVVMPRTRRRARGVKVATDGEIVWLQPPLEFKVAAEPLYLLKPEPEPEPRRAPSPSDSS